MQAVLYSRRHTGRCGRLRRAGEPRGPRIIIGRDRPKVALAAPTTGAGLGRSGTAGGARTCCTSERFVDQAPAEVYATLLDEGVYLCSSAPCTGSSRPPGGPRAARPAPPSRLRQARTAGHRAQPGLDVGHHQAARTRQVDLLLPLRHPRHLQPLRRRLDGRRPRERRTGQEAHRRNLRKAEHPAGQLTLHADRGSAMRSKPVALLLADLGVTKTHSRPYTSNDNPYSESQFRTMKYRPEFPDRFGCIQDSRAFCQTFFPWYNDEHRHSGIGMMSPADGAPRCGGQHPRKPPSRSRCRLSRPPRTLRPPTPFAASTSKGGLDQQTTKLRRRNSLNTPKKCLKVVDTRRNACSPLVVAAFAWMA